jgi:hypothetical protein
VSFRNFYKLVLENEEIYKADDFNDYSFVMVHRSDIKSVQKYLANSNLYEEGVNILVPVVTDPNNEVLQKAKEIAEESPSNLISNIKALRIWVKDNISDERLIELGLRDSHREKLPYRLEVGLPLAPSKTISEIFVKNYIVIPNSALKKHFSGSPAKFVEKLYENTGQYSVRIIELPSFNNSIQYKEYNPYSLTKQSKNMFGGLLNAI